MSELKRSLPAIEVVTTTLDVCRVCHNYSDPTTLQWRLIAAYDHKYPEARFVEQLQRQARRARELLRGFAAETLFGRDWEANPSKITERLVLNVRYSHCASPENLEASKVEVQRRRASDLDFDRRQKNAKHRSQERKNPVRGKDLVFFMANNWTNPNAPLWMAGVQGGAILVSQGLEQKVENARFKTSRDQHGLHSFSKRPLIVRRWRGFAVGQLELTEEAKDLVLEWEETVKQ